MNERKIILDDNYELIDDEYWISINDTPKTQGEVRVIEGKLHYAIYDRIYFDEPEYSVTHQAKVEYRNVWRWIPVNEITTDMVVDHDPGNTEDVKSTDDNKK